MKHDLQVTSSSTALFSHIPNRKHSTHNHVHQAAPVGLMACATWCHWPGDEFVKWKVIQNKKDLPNSTFSTTHQGLVQDDVRNWGWAHWRIASKVKWFDWISLTWILRSHQHIWHWRRPQRLEQIIRNEVLQLRSDQVLKLSRQSLHKPQPLQPLSISSGSQAFNLTIQSIQLTRKQNLLLWPIHPCEIRTLQLCSLDHKEWAPDSLCHCGEMHQLQLIFVWFLLTVNWEDSRSILRRFLCRYSTPDWLHLGYHPPHQCQVCYTHTRALRLLKYSLISCADILQCD